MTRFFVYDIPSVPDCEHHRLVTMCGGDVRGHIFRAGEQLLRIIANSVPDQISLALRFLFDPNYGGSLQKRLRVQLAVKIGDRISVDTVHQLVNAGPLADFYDFPEKPLQVESFGLPYAFSSVCEIVRQEEGIQPLVTREENDHIPSLYYALFPFECREDNDQLGLDRLLSKVNEPSVFEILARPVDQRRELADHYGYITHLMSVNQYGDDWIEGGYATASWADNATEGQLLTRARKRDPIADEILREHQDLHRNLRLPQLLFHAKAMANQPEHALMLASTAAESGLASGKYRLLSYNGDASDTADTCVARSLAESANLDVSTQAMYAHVWNRDLPEGWQGMKRLCRLATVDELKGLARLPVGGHGSPYCIRKATDPKPQAFQGTILIGDDLESKKPENRDVPDNLEELFAAKNVTNLELRLPIDSLTKHMFVAGVPGSGKTTAMFNLLVQLLRQGIPFLVIEPAKTEYRILKTLRDHSDPEVRRMAENLRVYTPGNDTISPLRFNPLEYPDGVSQDEHIGQVLSCFEAAMPLGGPLQALIAEAVEDVYEGREEGEFPRMADLVNSARRIMQAKQYEGEVKSNLQAAIEVRLGLLTRRAMGRIFDAHDGVPSVSELLEHPTIIEMDYLQPDHACLLTLFLLSAVREQIRLDHERLDGHLHHVTVVEEAHNIVGRTGDARASEDFADPKAFAAQYVSRMLAELRALGEGIVIADQLPSAVAPEVVKNTGTKLCHRLVSVGDRKELGGAMLLGSTEIEELARLEPGEAYFYTEGLFKPRRVRCLNAKDYLLFGASPTGTAIVHFLEDDQWFAAHLELRALQALAVIRHELVALHKAISDSSREGEGILLQLLPDALAMEVAAERRTELNELYSKLESMMDALSDTVDKGFHQRIWNPREATIKLAHSRFESVRVRAEEVAALYNSDVLTQFREVQSSLLKDKEHVRALSLNMPSDEHQIS